MHLGLFSISYAGLWGQASLDLPSFLERAGKLGFDSVMLAGKRPHLSPLDYDKAKLEKLSELLRLNHLQCPVLAAYVDLTAVVAGEVPLQEMQIRYVEQLCEMGAVLGAKIVRVFTGYETPGAPLQNQWRTVALCLREMCDRAAALNCTLALQNHHDIAVHTAALLELLADINRPNCKLGFDAWSPALRGEDLYQSALLAAPHTVITTNADYILLPRFRYRPELVNYEKASPDLVRAVPFGTGFIDYKRFFDGLREGGFTGLATYEMCSPIRGGGQVENLDSFAKSYLAWMKKYLGPGRP
ncbi:MAG: sugar phosphate isomerase/epimerase [Gemmataceae bacterium]|nr:sugar phosphate isomerase/epimerase [Gemmataceae bacterium]